MATFSLISLLLVAIQAIAALADALWGDSVSPTSKLNNTVPRVTFPKHGSIMGLDDAKKKFGSALDTPPNQITGSSHGNTTQKIYWYCGSVANPDVDACRDVAGKIRAEGGYLQMELQTCYIWQTGNCTAVVCHDTEDYVIRSEYLAQQLENPIISDCMVEPSRRNGMWSIVDCAEPHCPFIYGVAYGNLQNWI